jgi:hypothetical protein
VRSLERALERQPHLLGKWVFEALYRDDRGRPAVSYDLTDDGFCVFGRYVLGPKAIKRSFSYFEALMDKDTELRTAEAALPRTVAETMAEMEQAVRTGTEIDPKKLKSMLFVWIAEAGTILDKALELQKRNDALTQDNGRMTQQNAELADRIGELQIALCEKLDAAVSPSLFRN